jgi:hypothetical protein
VRLHTRPFLFALCAQRSQKFAGLHAHGVYHV